MSEPNDKIVIESITSPGRCERLNRTKYMAMRDAPIPVLPTEPPGIIVAEAKVSLLLNRAGSKRHLLILDQWSLRGNPLVCCKPVERLLTAGTLGL